MTRETYEGVQPLACAHEGCEAGGFKDHSRGRIRAHDAGWFIQKNGDAWCPEHTPEWVEAWRARQGRKT